MAKRNVTGRRYENAVCKRYGWTPKRTSYRARFTLMDAIKLNFNVDHMDDYVIHKRPFGIKYDALDKHENPIEIKKFSLIGKKGKPIYMPFSEYLSIKNYRDIYKLICEYNKIPYFNWNGKRRYVNFDALYKMNKKIIPLKTLKKLEQNKRDKYYKYIMDHCEQTGVTNWFNNFVETKEITQIFHNWVRHFKKTNFYVACKDGIFHSSQLVFNVRQVKSHWGFKRMTVFIKLKKNV